MFDFIKEKLTETLRHPNTYHVDLQQPSVQFLSLSMVHE